MTEIKCAANIKLDQCEYAAIAGLGIVCNYKGDCEYQRPKKPERRRSEPVYYE